MISVSNLIFRTMCMICIFLTLLAGTGSAFADASDQVVYIQATNSVPTPLNKAILFY